MVRQQTVTLWRKRGGSSPSTSTRCSVRDTKVSFMVEVVS